MPDQFTKLGAAFDKQSWNWLQEDDESIARAVQQEVADGASPDAIRRFILAHVGSNRSGIAERCMSAARHLESLKVKA